MDSVYVYALFGFVALFIFLIFCKVKVFAVLGVLLVISQIFCLVDIFRRYPSQVLWLCNLCVFLNIYLLFFFRQKLFDTYFFFTWIGCFFICLMPNNPYAVGLKVRPLFWMTYWIKHLIPLLMSFYFIRVKKRRLSEGSVYFAALMFLIYCGFIYLFDLFSGENVFYLLEPAPFMEPLGEHYFLIAIALGFLWVALVYAFMSFTGCVRYGKEKETNEDPSAPSPESGAGFSDVSSEKGIEESTRVSRYFR